MLRIMVPYRVVDTVTTRARLHKDNSLILDIMFKLISFFGHTANNLEIRLQFLSSLV